MTRSDFLIIAAIVLGVLHQNGKLQIDTWLSRLPAWGQPAQPAEPQMPVNDTWGFATSVPPTMASAKPQARRLGAMLREYARVIERDGLEESPQIADTKALDDNRDKLTRYVMGTAPAVTEPFVKVYADAFDKTFQDPDAGRPLDTALRATAVQFFNALGAALEGT